MNTRCNKPGCGIRLGVVTPCGCGDRCLAHCECPLAEAAKAPGRAKQRALIAALESGAIRITTKPMTKG